MRHRLGAVILMLVVLPRGACAEFGAREAAPRQPVFRIDADQLERTIVTPHLEQAIPAGSNVLWCATFQMAWNELREMAGGPVVGAPPSTLMEKLNQQANAAVGLEKSSYLAVAGLASRGMQKKIQKELKSKFNGRAKPGLLQSLGGMPRGSVFTYAYLNKRLPFRYEFDRFGGRLNFLGKEVESFGVSHLGDGGKRQALMAKQVAVLDYQNEDDLIVELLTRNRGDRLLLAKIPAGETLAETIAAVERRVANAEPTPMERAADLFVPVLDFDLSRRYRELEGRRLACSSRKLDGKPLQLAAQSIRFRLDERGAVVESEALGGFGGMGAKNLVFDKPFLIVTQRKRAKSPYFALWVANTELLVTQGD